MFVYLQIYMALQGMKNLLAQKKSGKDFGFTTFNTQMKP
jgi:hypothetical protein